MLAACLALLGPITEEPLGSAHIASPELTKDRQGARRRHRNAPLRKSSLEAIWFPHRGLAAPPYYAPTRRVAYNGMWCCSDKAERAVTQTTLSEKVSSRHTLIRFLRWLIMGGAVETCGHKAGVAV